MVITVSGKRKEVKDGLTVSELIRLEDVESLEYVSVSVNEEFPDRDQYDTLELKEGDTVEFLYFMGGGSGPRERAEEDRKEDRKEVRDGIYQ